MKHGRGKFTEEEEDPIFATFENDVMNGLGVQAGEYVLFKNGNKIDLAGNKCTCKMACQVFISILGFLGMLFLPIYIAVKGVGTSRRRR